MQVVVLTHDVAMGEMLEAAIRYVRPDAHVTVLDRERDAIEYWVDHRPDALVADSLGKLVDGVDVIRVMRQLTPSGSLIILTRYAQKATLETARRYRASALIVKPLVLNDLVERLRQGLPTKPDVAPLQNDSVAPEDWFQQWIADDRLSMPLSAPLREAIFSSDLSNATIKDLHRLWKKEPAVVARLLGAANTSEYNDKMVNCESLGAALNQLGAVQAVSIVDSLALQCGSVLSDEFLAAKAQQLTAYGMRVGQKAASLAAKARLDASACYDAGLLSIMGELAALEVLQCWLDHGHELTEEQVDSLVAHYAIPMSHQLKRAWRIPMVIRDRAGSVHQLPDQITLRRDRMAMRAAGLLVGGDDPAEARRLLDLLGVDEPVDTD